MVAAVRVHKAGGPEVLTYEQIEIGAPGPGQVKLKQHAGKAAAPVVEEGAKVRKGQVVARVDEPDLGAHIHSSIDGKVRKVTEWIEIS